MKKGIRAAVTASVAVAALTLGACSSTDSSSSSSSGSASSAAAGGLEVHLTGDYNVTPRDEIQDGGELRLAIGELVEQQNLFHGNMTADTRLVWTWYNPQVILYEGDGTYVPNPDYIVDVKDEVVDGNTVVTYALHPDAVFNDDTPIDWRAYEATWKANNGSDEAYVVNSTSGYKQITSVTAGANDKEVVVTYAGAYPWWQGQFNDLLHPSALPVDVFSEGYLNQLRPEWGAGPFKVENVDFQAGTVSFVPNEKWWGDAPKLERVSFREMEAQASINAFRAGEIDATGASSKERLETVRGMGDKVQLNAALLPATYLITLNSEAPLLGDIKVREAIMTGFDRAQMATVRFNGLDYTEDLPGSFTMYQIQEGYQDNFSKVAAYDPEKAKALLDEAGWTEGADGIREKDGQKLELRYVLLGDSALSKSLAAVVQATLKNIGVNVIIQERPSSDFANVVEAKEFDIFFSGFLSSDPYGVAGIDQIYASDSTLNNSGTGTPEIDQQLVELFKLPTAEEQIARANEIELEALKTYGIMPVYNGPSIIASVPGLANYGAYAFAVVPREDIGWKK